MNQSVPGKPRIKWDSKEGVWYTHDHPFGPNRVAGYSPAHVIRGIRDLNRMVSAIAQRHPPTAI